MQTAPSRSPPQAPSATRLLLIETHSPWESGDVVDFLDLVRVLLGLGLSVHLHLIQNGVIWLRGSSVASLKALGSEFAQQFQISSDDVSLDLRGMDPGLARHVGSVWGINDFIGRMAEPDVKTIWHS